MHGKNKPPSPQQEYVYGTRSERGAKLRSLGGRALQNNTNRSGREARTAARTSNRAILGFASAQENALNNAPSGLEFAAKATGSTVDAYVDRPEDDPTKMRWVVRVVNDAADRVTTFSLRTGRDDDYIGYDGTDGTLNDISDFQIVDPETGKGYDGFDYSSRLDQNELNRTIGTAFSALSNAQEQGTLQVTKLPDKR